MTTCNLCTAVSNEPEEAFILPLYEGGLAFEILKTKDSKGHKHRYMVVAERHTETVSEFEANYAMGRLFEFMLSRKLDMFTILQPTHASIKNHWHLVSSSMDIGNDEDKIADTQRIEVRLVSPK